MIKELFLSLCVVTSLQCTDVRVGYHEAIRGNTLAMAALDVKGNSYVLVNREARRQGERMQKQILIHELAHLVVWQTDPTDNSHGEAFDDACEILTKDARLDVNKTCSVNSSARSYWNHRAHYRRDD